MTVAAMTPIAHLHCRSGYIGKVAVHLAIAVVHWTHKLPWTTASATAALLLTIAPRTHAAGAALKAVSRLRPWRTLEALAVVSAIAATLTGAPKLLFLVSPRSTGALALTVLKSLAVLRALGALEPLTILRTLATVVIGSAMVTLMVRSSGILNYLSLLARKCDRHVSSATCVHTGDNSAIRPRVRSLRRTVLALSTASTALAATSLSVGTAAAGISATTGVTTDAGSLNAASITTAVGFTIDADFTIAAGFAINASLTVAAGFGTHGRRRTGCFLPNRFTRSTIAGSAVL